MNNGYLYLETRDDYPGVIRLKVSAIEPSVPDDSDGSRIEYVARFDDVEAARLHVHNGLRHHLLDINFNTYNAPLEKAVAVMEADNLRHHRVWISPHLATNCLDAIEQQSKQLQKRQRIRDRLWQVVGWIAIVWVVMLLILL